MGLLDDWHDIVRALAFCLSLYSIVTLIFLYAESGSTWNIKTKDYWYAVMMWSFAGCAFTLQGIALNEPFTPAFVFLVAAVLVSGKGLHRKGPWGSHDS